MPETISPDELLASLAARFAAIPEVQAVTLSGSVVTGARDAWSDIDVVVYTTTEIGLTQRRAIADAYADQIEIDNRFFEPGDEWITRDNRSIDIMYRSPEWIQQQLERVLIHHQASLGYTTCFAFNVQTSRIYYDPTQWFARLQDITAQLYPPALQRAIVALNYPLLRTTQSSYLHQVDLAIRREDVVSVNHRLSAIFASYFDILFAVNRLLHPGEKRLIAYAQQHCALLPDGMANDILALIHAMSDLRESDLLGHLHHLCAALQQVLQQEKLLPI